MNLEEKSTAELLTLYNQAATTLGRKRVNRFADRKTALRRAREIMAETAEQVMQPGTEAKRPKGFNFPVRKTVKSLRKGTLRARLADALRQGITFQGLQELITKYDVSRGMSPKNVKIRAYEATRLLHFYCGYGLTEDGDGVIRLVESK